MIRFPLIAEETPNAYCGDNGGAPCITLRTRKEYAAMLISILSLVVGGLVGLMTSLLMGTEARQGILLNIIHCLVRICPDLGAD